MDHFGMFQKLQWKYRVTLAILWVWGMFQKLSQKYNATVGDSMSLEMFGK